MGTQATPAPNGAEHEQQPRAAASLLDLVVNQTDQQTKDRIIMRREEVSYKKELAKLFADSGCFSDIKGQTKDESIAKAFVKIEMGESMGFSPAESMSGIDIIQGRVAVGANLRAARMQRAGFAWRFRQMDNKGCVLVVYFKGQPMHNEDGTPATASFTEEDAKSAGLFQKDNYKKNPSDMYFARAITRAQRRYAPGVLGVDILSTEEALDLRAADEISAPVTGSIRAAAEVAEEKLARMRGVAPGETEAERDARIDRQIAEQSAATADPPPPTEEEMRETTRQADEKAEAPAPAKPQFGMRRR